MDLSKEYGAPPEEQYFEDLRNQLLAVEHDVKDNYDTDAAVVHNQKELADASTTQLTQGPGGSDTLNSTAPQVFDNNVGRKPPAESQHFARGG